MQRAFPDCSLRGAAETLADFRARCLASPEITTIRPSGYRNCHGLRLLFWRKYPHPAMPDRCFCLHFNHSPTCHHSVFFREILLVTKNNLDILLIVSKMPEDSENINIHHFIRLITPRLSNGWPRFCCPGEDKLWGALPGTKLNSRDEKPWWTIWTLEISERNQEEKMQRHH